MFEVERATEALAAQLAAEARCLLYLLQRGYSLQRAQATLQTTTAARSAPLSPAPGPNHTPPLEHLF